MAFARELLAWVKAKRGVIVPTAQGPRSRAPRVILLQYLPQRKPLKPFKPALPAPRKRDVLRPARPA